MTTQATIGNSFLKSLITLREQKGNLSIEDVGEMFESIASSLHHSDNQADQFLRNEINRMAQYIDNAKQEIAALTPEDEKKGFNDATLQLDAVVKATEEASNSIMDSADKIQGAVSGVGGDKEKAIMEETNKIYEACNFQDLTGQRIRKVMAMINEIDERVHKLVGLFGVASNATEAVSNAAKDSNVIQLPKDEKDLLNGPQLKPPTQAEIDALFSSIKP